MSTQALKQVKQSHKRKHHKYYIYVISPREREYFDLPFRRNDSTEFYIILNSIINESLNTAIDHFLLKQYTTFGFTGCSFKTKQGYYVPRDEIKARIQQKIDVATLNGDIYIERFRNYLKQAAYSYNLDVQQFNGFDKYIIL